MNKRYQVFISSTYADLQDERQEIIQALLELGCIPSGMELFPAANEDQWSLIKRVIDDCDYYLLVVGGRYGSMGPAGISYTEMEYRYALEAGKPIIAFLHKNPQEIAAGKSESSDQGKAQLAVFRELVQKKLCKFWTTPHDLGGVVSRSLVQLFNTTPAVGWVRGDLVPDESAAVQLVQLHQKIEVLEQELAHWQTKHGIPIEDLASGEAKFELVFTATAYDEWHNPVSYIQNNRVKLSWNNILGAIGPDLLNGASKDTIARALNRLVSIDGEGTVKKFLTKENQTYSSIDSYTVDSEDVETVVIQFRALGYIEQHGRNWILTKSGDAQLMNVRAIRK